MPKDVKSKDTTSGYARYKKAQSSKRDKSDLEQTAEKNRTTEEYLGRLEQKYKRKERGQPTDQGHDEVIHNLGNRYRKLFKLPRYKQTDPSGDTTLPSRSSTCTWCQHHRNVDAAANVEGSN